MHKRSYYFNDRILRRISVHDEVTRDDIIHGELFHLHRCMIHSEKHLIEASTPLQIKSINDKINRRLKKGLIIEKDKKDNKTLHLTRKGRRELYLAEMVTW